MEHKIIFYFQKSEAVLGELSVKYCILNHLCVSVRSCLLLITDCPSLVQEELDLISALSRLEQFGVKVLPLQGNAALSYYYHSKLFFFHFLQEIGAQAD